ncbi:hypothetical protein PM082_002237 [Marasmius tenuissimus]|nr:hypothetical protein PM082_002237 [Marasmius tenuissimus]
MPSKHLHMPPRVITYEQPQRLTRYSQPLPQQLSPTTNDSHARDSARLRATPDLDRFQYISPISPTLTSLTQKSPTLANLSFEYHCNFDLNTNTYSDEPYSIKNYDIKEHIQEDPRFFHLKWVASHRLVWEVNDNECLVQTQYHLLDITFLRTDRIFIINRLITIALNQWVFEPEQVFPRTLSRDDFVLPPPAELFGFPLYPTISVYEFPQQPPQEPTPAPPSPIHVADSPIYVPDSPVLSPISTPSSIITTLDH